MLIEVISTKRIAEIGTKNLLAWSLLRSYESASTAKIKELFDFYHNGLGGPIPSIEIEQLKKTPVGWQIKLRRDDGRTAVVVLDKQPKAISGRMDK